jgi:hypothetical protein
MPATRTAPPTGAPNNQDVFIWALYLLGGADREIDVEEIYLKAFELAPARLSWRTRTDLPDYKKTSKALQSAESVSHVGLVHKTNPLARKLTSSGSHWIEANRAIFETVYGGKAVAAPRSSAPEQFRTAFKSSATFQKLQRNATIDRIDLAEALGCSPSSPHQIWLSRIEQLERSADVMRDAELAEAALLIRQMLRLEKK